MSIVQWVKDQFDPDKKIERLNKAAELEKSRGKLLAVQAQNKKLKDKISPPKKETTGFSGYNTMGKELNLSESVVGINFGGERYGSNKKRQNN